VCRPGNTFTSSLDFRKDRIGRGGPDERLRVGVGSSHLLIDFLHLSLANWYGGRETIGSAKRAATKNANTRWF